MDFSKWYNSTVKNHAIGAFVLRVRAHFLCPRAVREKGKFERAYETAERPASPDPCFPHLDDPGLVDPALEEPALEEPALENMGLY